MSLCLAYDELGWERLDDRRKKPQRLQVFYKTIIYDTHIYLQNIAPNRIHKTSINCVMKLTIPIPKLEHHSSKNVFPLKTINDWNKLDNDTSVSISLE